VKGKAPSGRKKVQNQSCLDGVGECRSLGKKKGIKNACLWGWKKEQRKMEAPYDRGRKRSVRFDCSVGNVRARSMKRGELIREVLR